MQVALKITVVMMLATIAAFAVVGYIEVRQEVQRYEVRLAEDLFDVGRGLGHAFYEVARSEGRARAQEVLRYTDDRLLEVNIRWVSLDPAQGSPPHFRRERLNAVAEGNELMVIAREEDEGNGMLYAYVPIEGTANGAIELAQSLREETDFRRNAFVDQAVAAILTAFIATLLATVVGMYFVGRPMQRLVAQAQRVGRGNLSLRIELQQRDEVGQLAREMNAMCDRLEEARRAIAVETEERLKTVEQLRHADRLVTVGKLASGVAHELGTPLNVVSGRAKMIVDAAVATDVAENAKIIRAQTERMTLIIRHLLDFARRREPRRVRTDVANVARQALSLVGPLAQKKGVDLRFAEPEEDVSALVDPMQIEQVLSNLVVNGIHAMKNGGTLEVSARRERLLRTGDVGTPASCLSIYVRDEGEGIAKENVDRIFEPFFTTKGVGEGTGLGLSVTYGIITDHGGWLTVDSEPGRGSTFGVHVPDDGPPEVAT